MRRLLHLLTKRTLVQNTVWALAGQGLATLVRGFYLIILARSLGAEQYGTFAAVLAVVSILAGFGPLGTGYVLLQNVARNAGRLPTAWGNSILVTAVGATALTLLLMTFHGLVFPPSVTLLVIGLTALAQILLYSVTETAGQAFQAFQRLEIVALIQVLTNVTKLIAAAVLNLTTPSPTVLQWSSLYFLSALVAAMIAMALVHRELGTPLIARSRIPGELKDGAYFAVSATTQASYNEIDKAMLARLSTLEATGIYAASHRLIYIVLVPVRSVFFAALARFFQHGAHGIGGSVGFARRLAPITLGYALCASVLLFVSAPLAPHLLGADYQAAVDVIRWLSVIPLLSALHSLASNALIGAGHQQVRTYALVVAALTNVGVNLWLIPRYSWRGAAWSRIATEMLLVCLLWALTWHRYRSSERATTPGAAPP
jgi:O-antigen/teichoic acid export membrane protein